MKIYERLCGLNHLKILNSRKFSAIILQVEIVLDDCGPLQGVTYKNVRLGVPILEVDSSYLKE